MKRMILAFQIFLCGSVFADNQFYCDAHCLSTLKGAAQAAGLTEILTNYGQRRAFGFSKKDALTKFATWCRSQGGDKVLETYSTYTTPGLTRSRHFPPVMSGTVLIVKLVPATEERSCHEYIQKDPGVVDEQGNIRLNETSSGLATQ